ncbi:MAG: YccF domain-containing protein [Dehalococcoidia bacterium]
MTDPIVIRADNPGCVLRIAWFLLVGWWLGGIVSAAAWALNATIILLPFGLWIINRLPTIITLAPQVGEWRLEHGMLSSNVRQFPMLLRAIYFLLVGWWLSGLWMAAAYLFVISIAGLPIAFVMYNQIGFVTTLHRS